MRCPPSLSDTQYARHRSARLSYQNRYNSIKRTCGRRKIGKRDREIMEDRRQAELNGDIPEVINHIARKSSAMDPERTAQMAEDERFLNSECMELKRCISQNTDCDQLATWTRKIEASIEYYRSQAIAYIQTSSGAPKMQTIHAYRRKIAVLHEFLDLHRQGHDAFVLASAWGKTVYSGRSVKKTVFKRLYGF
ncbi:hypothetical protein EW026_g4957 [Hermanssonia centrifuga]|uniref:Uncharacterized protein n=1 Tax=Hermanssonia centrifuga TaxID=98765 RepID=A0A4S4KK21_9APHY|nr:hypothetical protein EW026_g4957 [Hermanssonia centrifuga]